MIFTLSSVLGLLPWLGVNSTSALEVPASLSFTELATHPQAASQATSSGRRIQSLQLFDGMLLAGYGDYNLNSGPITINPYMVSNGTFAGAALSMPTESIGSWTEINGKLYVPTIDPTCSGTCPAGYALYAPGEGWEMKLPVSAEHIFDITTLTGTDIWLFGSAGGDSATAWRSTDGGTSFSVVRDNTSQPGVNNTERYYWGRALNGKMYMQSDLSGNTFPAQIFDGVSWSEGTSQNICGTGGNWPGPNPVIYDNLIVCPGTSRMTYFDGSAVGTFGSNTVNDTNFYQSCNTRDGDIESAGDFLYALCWTGNSNARIIRTNNLQSRLQSFTGVPALATAIEIDELEKKIYVGTSDSKLYVADLPQNNQPPEVSIVRPLSGFNSKTNALRVKVEASDDIGVSKVELLLNGQLIGEDYSDSRDFLWEDETDLPSGVYSLTARAYDLDLNVQESEPVSINLTKEYSVQNYPASTETVLTKGVVVDDANNAWSWAAKRDGQSPTVGLSKTSKNTGEVDYFWSGVPYDGFDGFDGTYGNRVALDPDEDVWLASCDPNSSVITIQEFKKPTGTFSEYQTSISCGFYGGYILPSSDGNTWYVNDMGPVVRISSNGTVSYHEFSETFPVALGATLNQNGNVVLQATDFETSEVVTLNSSGAVEQTFSLPVGVLGVSVATNTEGNILVGNVASESVQIVELSPSGALIDTYESIMGGSVSSVSEDGDKLWLTFEDYSSSKRGLMSIDKQNSDEQFYSADLSGYANVDFSSDNTVWFSDSVRLRHIYPTPIEEDPELPDEGSNSASPLTDINGDGIVDSSQPHVQAFTAPGTDTPVGLVVSDDCTLADTSIATESSKSTQDPAYSYPNGLVSFTADCGTPGYTTTVNLYYYDTTPNDLTLRKYNPTTNAYFNLTGQYGATLEQTTLNNRTVTIASYQITDGEDLDIDNQANGSIQDPVGLAQQTTGSADTGLPRHWLLGVRE